MPDNVIYTGHFIQDPTRLLAQIPPRVTGEHSTVYAHHVTKEFKPPDGAESVTPGRQRILRAIGQVAANGVHAVLVESVDGDSISANQHPHLTIATAEGVPPGKSNEVVAAAIEAGTVDPLDPPVEFTTVEGYFSGGRVTTSTVAGNVPPPSQ